MLRFITKETLQKHLPRASARGDVDLRKHVRATSGSAGLVLEFVGAGDFADAFYQRQRYEVDAGRDEEPILYRTLYDEIVDPNLPKEIPINVLGPGGVTFELIQEGAEVKMMTIGESTRSISLAHYAVGLEYTQELFEFNQVWRLAPIERWVGAAFNALKNHVHLYPIISYNYGSANQTAAHTASGLSLEELYLRTIEDAITHSVGDASNPRRGPYDLLIASGDMFMVERALKRRVQDGIDVQSSAVNRVQNVIVYDGWSGSRGKKTVSYAGVAAGTAYLISKQYRAMDFQSYVKIDLRRQAGESDMSRFIVEQDLWDSWFTCYCNVAAAVEEITWPTSAS